MLLKLERGKQRNEEKSSHLKLQREFIVIHGFLLSFFKKMHKVIHFQMLCRGVMLKLFV